MEARRDIFVQAAKEIIERYEQKMRYVHDTCTQETAYLLSQLDNYLDTTPAKKTKTQISITLPSGKLVRKFPGIDYVRDNDALLAWCKENKPEFIRIKEEPAWEDIKRHITETGTVPNGVEPVKKPAAFDVK